MKPDAPSPSANATSGYRNVIGRLRDKGVAIYRIKRKTEGAIGYGLPLNHE